MSICTVGSLFSGFPRAAVFGQKIFDRPNKAALASVRIGITAHYLLPVISLPPGQP